MLPNNNACPRLNLNATLRTLYMLRKGNTCPQTETVHPPTLDITANMPQVATAAPGQPRLRHASRSRARTPVSMFRNLLRVLRAPLDPFLALDKSR